MIIKFYILFKYNTSLNRENKEKNISKNNRESSSLNLFLNKLKTLKMFSTHERIKAMWIFQDTSFL